MLDGGLGRYLYLDFNYKLQLQLNVNHVFFLKHIFPCIIEIVVASVKKRRFKNKQTVVIKRDKHPNSQA